METREQFVTKARTAYVICLGSEGRELYYRGPDGECVEYDEAREVALIRADADRVKARKRWESLPVQNR